jgi:CelD/BcsL family acetyltransferase involved in cellulose biosynthesis
VVARLSPPTVRPPGARVVATTLDPVGDSRWGDLVARAPDSTAFHHPAWIALVRGHYGYAVDAWCLEAPGGSLVAGLPVATTGNRVTGRRLVALPFSDHCSPLLAAGADPGTAARFATVIDAMRRAEGLALEVRGAGAVLAEAPAGARFHHHVLHLSPDVDAVVRRFRKPQVLRGVRRALREGLTVEQRADPAALDEFYRLHVATRARLGLPTQPRRFILRFAELFAAGRGFVLVVRRDKQAIAAAVFLVHRDVLTYKYGASDERFLGSRPNNLLFMEAVRWGSGHGMRALDFGRTDWDHESLRAFKLAWGSEELELRYRHLGDARPDNGRGTLARALSGVLRRSPPLASRLAGELLYRHAA